MGEYADMMIEAIQNGGVTDDGIIMDTETGEVLGFEEDMPTREEQQKQRLKQHQQKVQSLLLRVQSKGHTAQLINDYHMRVNGELDFTFKLGLWGTKYRKVGSTHPFKPCQGVLAVLHNHYHQNG